MKYIAALDYDHLDNGVFLTTLARSLSQQQAKEESRPIIVHSNSKYTERIIQTGVMRDEATIRSIKDLNNRLVALFADQGVSTVGINPNRRKMITRKNGVLSLDHSFFDTLPRRSVLLLSTLIHNIDTGKIEVLSLPKLVSFLDKELGVDQLFIFSKSDKSEIFTADLQQKQMYWESLEEGFIENQIPNEFIQFNTPVILTNARDFNQIPNLEHTISINTK